MTPGVALAGRMRHHIYCDTNDDKGLGQMLPLDDAARPAARRKRGVRQTGTPTGVAGGGARGVTPHKNLSPYHMLWLVLLYVVCASVGLLERRTEASLWTL